MASEWQSAQLGEVSDLLTGFPFRSDDYVDDPCAPRLLRGDNVAQGVLRWDGAKRYPRTAASSVSAYELCEGDVILAMDRPWIEAGLKFASVRSSDLPAMLVQRVARLRGSARLDSGFLKYVIGSPSFTDHVLAQQTGTAVPHISGSQIKSYRFLLPPLPEQRAIADILGTLDDKIDLNRRMSETLEAMARTLFKSWLDAQPRDRVPVAELVAKGVLEIGDGYRAKNDELASPGLPFIRAGDLLRGIRTQGADVLRQASVDRAGSKVSRSGDVAFTSKGTIGRFARVSRHTPQCVYSPQVCYWRSLDPASLHTAVLYAWMISDDLGLQIEAVSGQTDMAPYVSLSDQRRMGMPRFPASQVVIGQRLEALFSRQDEANAESQILASIRDALLPGLITGELRPAALSGRTSHLARG